MLPDRRAIVFDMDDTLYGYRRFVRSGFAAVASYLQRTWRTDPRRVLKSLIRASRGPARGKEIQATLRECRLPAALESSLISVMRTHTPRISLQWTARRALADLKRAGWQLAVLTNGPREVQAGKVAALGLAQYVDTIVYATEHGSGASKPDPEPFAEVLKRLQVPAYAAVFVGDDETCDVLGASGAGFSTIRWTRHRSDATSAADAMLNRWSALAPTAERLIREAATRHAA